LLTLGKGLGHLKCGEGRRPDIKGGLKGKPMFYKKDHQHQKRGGIDVPQRKRKGIRTGGIYLWEKNKTGGRGRGVLSQGGEKKRLKRGKQIFWRRFSRPLYRGERNRNRGKKKESKKKKN